MWNGPLLPNIKFSEKCIFGIGKPDRRTIEIVTTTKIVTYVPTLIIYANIRIRNCTRTMAYAFWLFYYVRCTMYEYTM